MNFPENLLYSKSHEWIKMLDDGSALVGLTDYAQSALSDLVFVNLPLVGDPLTVGGVFADVESVKAVSDVFSPLTGTIAAVNDELADAPQLINESPYDAWIVRVEGITEKEELIDAQAYAALVEAEQ